MLTFSQIIQNVETELSLLGGVDVQTYGQPKLARKLQGAFNEVFDKRWWVDHLKSNTWTLDANGLSTTNLTNEIKRFGDIQYIFLNQWREPLPQMPGRMNPSLVRRTCFTSYASAPAGYFKVIAANAGDTVYVTYRTKLADFIDTDVVPFDPDYLTWQVAGDFLVDESANLQAAQKFLKKAQDRLKTVIDIETNDEKDMHSYTQPYLTEWR